MKSSKFTLLNDRFSAKGKTITRGRLNTLPYVKELVNNKELEKIENAPMRERNFPRMRYIWNKLLKSKE